VSQARPLLHPRTTALFVSCRGKGIDHTSILCIVQRLIQEAGVQKKVNLHSIRHSCATHMLNRGADIRFVQELLGHACLSTTQVYTRVSITKLKQTHAKHHPREQADF
jgi:integrase/recombinase XerD